MSVILLYHLGRDWDKFGKIILLIIKILNIELDSTVMYQFGEQIKKVIAETLTSLGVTSANVKATDKGALDCTIKARVTCAAVRATGKDVWA